MSIDIDEIASGELTRPTDIRKYIFEKDKYKKYREFAMEINKGSTMEIVVRYLKKYPIFHVKTETYLLNTIIGFFPGLSLTRNNWDMIKFVLGNINFKFSQLSSDNQILLLNEIRQGAINILTDHFRDRCDELQGTQPPNNDDNRPTVQWYAYKAIKKSNPKKI